MTIRLSNRYFRIYGDLLRELGDEHANRLECLGVEPARIGKKYRRGGFMLVGRAVNGVGRTAWCPAQMQTETKRKRILAELREPWGNQWLL
jgi:hypothetical protein